MKRSVHWFPLKFPPDRGTVLKPVKENGTETIFETKRALRYRRVVNNGEVRWFSNSKQAAGRHRNQLAGGKPKATAKPKARPQWHPLKHRPPASDLLLEIVKFQGPDYVFQSWRGDLYRCEIHDGVERWFSNAKIKRRGP
jgi:hypothetical protein